MRAHGLLAICILSLNACAREDESRQVLAVVLDHFSRRTDTSSLDENGVIVIEPTAGGWREGSFSGLTPMDDQPACTAGQQLYDRFVERNRKELVASDLFGTDKRWRTVKPEELEQLPLLVSSDGNPLKTVMTLYAPGFSSDGRQAFVLLAFSWSMHGARAGYVLEKNKGGWNIKCSLLNFYV